MKANILADFPIGISVPLKEYFNRKDRNFDMKFYIHLFIYRENLKLKKSIRIKQSYKRCN